MNENQIEVLLAQISCFMHSENKYQHDSGYHYTDGIKFIVEKLHCSWLLDTILFSQEFKVLNKNKSYQDITINVNIYYQTGCITFKDKSGDTIHTQNISMTEFPIKELTLKYNNGLLQLPSEVN